MKPKKPKRPPYNARAALARVLRLFALPALAVAVGALVLRQAPESPTRGFCAPGCNSHDVVKPIVPSGFCMPPGSHCRAGR